MTTEWKDAPKLFEEILGRSPFAPHIHIRETVFTDDGMYVTLEGRYTGGRGIPRRQTCIIHDLTERSVETFLDYARHTTDRLVAVQVISHLFNRHTGHRLSVEDLNIADAYDHIFTIDYVDSRTSEMHRFELDTGRPLSEFPNTGVFTAYASHVLMHTFSYTGEEVM